MRFMNMIFMYFSIIFYTACDINFCLKIHQTFFIANRCWSPSKQEISVGYAYFGKKKIIFSLILVKFKTKKTLPITRNG